MVAAVIALFKSSSIQTYVGAIALEQVFADYPGEVRVERISLTKLDDLNLGGVYAEDVWGDTLIYLDRLHLELLWEDVKRLQLRSPHVSLSGGIFNLRTVKGDSINNLSYLLEIFKSEEADTSSSHLFLEIKSIDLMDFRFTMINENDSSFVKGINYNDIAVDQLSASFNSLSINGDSISAHIEHLSAIEKSGIEIDTLASFITLNPSTIALDSLKLKTNRSSISGRYQMAHGQYSYFANYVDSMVMSATLSSCSISGEDVALFAEALSGLYQQVAISGEFEGTVNDFELSDFVISIPGRTFLKGEMSARNITDFQNADLMLKIDNSRIVIADLENIQLPPFEHYKTLDLPEQVRPFQSLEVKGSFEGSVKTFNTSISFNSPIGSGSTRVEAFEELDTLHYDGLIKLRELDLGRILGQEDLGTVSMDGEVLGQGLMLEKIDLELLGFVKKIQFRGYDYNSITIDGFFQKEKFSGFVDIKDDNLVLNFNGSLDFQKDKPELNFRTKIDSFYPVRCKLLERDSSLFLSGRVSMGLTGLTFDDAVGDAGIESLVVREGNNEFDMEIISLHSYFSNSIRRLEFSSPNFFGILKGNYKSGNAINAFQNILYHSAPSLFAEVPEKANDQAFSAFLEITDVNPLLDIFVPGIHHESPIVIRSRFNAAEKDFSLILQGDDISFNNMEFHDYKLTVDMKDSLLKENFSIKQFDLGEQVLARDVYLNTEVESDSIRTSIHLNRTEEAENDIYTDIHGRIKPGKRFTFSIDSNRIVLGDSLWTIDDFNGIEIDTDRVVVKGLDISSEGKYFNMNGVYSNKPGDELYVHFKGLNLANVSDIIGEEIIKMTGHMTGVASFNSLATEPYIMSDIQFQELTLNERKVGNGFLESFWNSEKDRFEIDFDMIRYPDSIIKDTIKSIRLFGNYYPQGGDTAFDVFFSTEGLHLHIFEPFVDRFMDRIEGKLLGFLSFKGSVNRPLLTGNLHFDSTSFRVKYLNTTYSIHQQQLKFEPDWFGFDRLEIEDQNKKEATAIGTVYHSNWRDFNFDVSVNMDEFLVLNTQSTDNELFYGKTFLTGYANVSGHKGNLDLSIFGKTAKNSVINIPAYGATDVGESSYITFVKPDWMLEPPDEKAVDLSGINMEFDLEIDPKTQARIIFDETSGDMIESKGTGSIKMSIDQAANFEMFGDYEIVSGSYLFSYENVFSKKFGLDPGGKITWTGDPLNAILDITATYSVRAPLGPILGDTTQTKKVDNVCLMHISDRLNSPNFGFDIRLNNVGQDVENQVKSQMPTPEEVNKQFFSLLLFNKYQPAQSNFGGSGFAGATTSELLANQLNLMLSKLENDIVDIGFTQIRQDNVEVALSKNLMNDRLIFESNVGVDNTGANQTSASADQGQNQGQFVGDFKLEYLVRPDGKVRAKVFNRTESVSLENQNSGAQTQGIGLFFRHDFESYPGLFRDIFSKKDKKKK